MKVENKLNWTNEVLFFQVHYHKIPFMWLSASKLWIFYILQEERASVIFYFCNSFSRNWFECDDNGLFKSGDIWLDGLFMRWTFWYTKGQQFTLIKLLGKSQAWNFYEHQKLLLHSYSVILFCKIHSNWHKMIINLVREGNNSPKLPSRLRTFLALAEQKPMTDRKQKNID